MASALLPCFSLPLGLFCMMIVHISNGLSCDDIYIKIETELVKMNKSDVCNEAVATSEDDATHYYICSTLQSALELSEQQNEDCNISVTVSKGQHLIISPVLIVASFNLLGETNHQLPIIKCNFTGANFDATNKTNYTIHFNHSNSVHLQDILMWNCPFPLGIDTVLDVQIHNTQMSYFDEAVLEIFNSRKVYISSSSFKMNQGTGVSQSPFKGNTGAVSVGFYKYPKKRSMENLSVEVVDTTFFNNSAFANQTTFRSTSKAFFKGILPGRAGGLGVFVHENNHNVSIKVTNCTFKNNFATSYGGGLYFVYSGNNAVQRIAGKRPQFKGYVSNCSFIGNAAGFGGGGFIITIQTSGPLKAPHLLYFDSCKFEENIGNSGGGFYYYVIFHGGRGNSLVIKNTNFKNNTGNSSSDEFGSAFAASIYQEFKSMDGFPHHLIEDCTFIGNRGTNSIVSIGYVPFIINGTNTFENNTGESLRIIGTQAVIGGTIIFKNNSAQNRGALSLVSFAQLRLREGLKLHFLNNNGRYGASIYVDPFDYSEAFKKLFYNPHCFILPEQDTMKPPENWNKRFSMIFEGNKALFGSAVYVSSLSQCSWVSEKGPQFFNKTYFPHWPIFNVSGNNNTGVSDSLNQSHSIVTGVVSFELDSSEVLAWPGKKIALNITSRDELGGPTGSLVHMKHISHKSEKVNKSGESQGLQLNPNSFLMVNEPFQFNFTFSILSTSECVIKEKQFYSLNPITSSMNEGQPFNAFDDENKIAINSSNCPVGYNLLPVEDNSTNDSLSLKGCVCETKKEQVLLCANDQDSFIIQAGQWAVGVADETAASLHFYPCPPGYCRCFNESLVGDNLCTNKYFNSDPDMQCTQGRRGILCGSCRDGMHRTALLEKCSHCRVNLPWFWFIILGIVDIPIVILIIIIDKPLPSLFYPMLFYIQIMPLLTLYYSSTFSALGEYLYYASSLIGLYLPYDFCLKEDINGILPHLLKFTPLLAIVLVLLVFIVINPILKRCERPLRMHGLWTVFLMLYTTTLYNALRNLYCPKIYSGSSYAYYWYINGSIQCFTGFHWILTVLGLIFLFINLLVIMFLAGMNIRRDCSERWVEKISNAISYPYNQECYYWGTVDVTSKLLLVLIVVVFPGNRILLVLSLSLILGIYCYKLPYKCKWTNYLQIGISSLMLILQTLEAAHNLSYFFQKLSHHHLVTPEDILLLILYYAPLIILIVIVFSIILHSCGLTKFRAVFSLMRARRSGYHPIDGNTGDCDNPLQLQCITTVERSMISSTEVSIH